MLLFSVAAAGASVNSTISLSRIDSLVGNPVMVHGLSSGAFFAAQMAVAYSDLITAGAAIVAGGPFYCAQDSMVTAVTTCMSLPSGINVAALVAYAQQQQGSGGIAQLSNLAQRSFYFESGTMDSVVNPGVVRSAVQFFQNVGAGNISAKADLPAQHCQPTNDYGNSCGMLGSPYISNCGYDAAGASLQMILPGFVKAAGTAQAGTLQTFDQTPYPATSLDTQGYLYVGPACSKPGAKCALVVSLHGCSQGRQAVGNVFALNNGYSKWADANNLVVLYPQVVPSFFSSNPNGCWDWWGYAGADYALRTGVQMKAVANMIKALTGQ